MDEWKKLKVRIMDELLNKGIKVLYNELFCSKELSL